MSARSNTRTAKKATAKPAKAAAKKATPAKADDRARAAATVAKEGTKVCAGAGGEQWPRTKFGTSRDGEGGYVRDDECRACRDARRAAKRAEREASKANAA